MKKTVYILLIFFVFSVSISGLLNGKSTTAKSTKKIVKKKNKVEKDPIVYVKEKGKKYHKKNCKLASGKKGIKLSGALKKGYEACKICYKTDTVYVTGNGKKYHKKGCKMAKNLKPIDLGVAKDKGYSPCKLCFHPVKEKKDLKTKK